MGKDESTSDDNKQIKINKWDYLALKNTLDDAVKDVLINKYNHIEDFSLIDCRLLICTFAVLVAGFALAWDYFNPFPKSRFVLTICVALYFVTMGAITLYTTHMEKGIFAVTKERDESGYNPEVVWEASSYIKKHTGMYCLSIIRKDSVKKNIKERDIVKSVANYFDDEGTLCQEVIEKEVSIMRDAILKLKKIE
ncbi:Signal peptidase complex subunit 2 [Cinara cedri]|uniref:Signal peptidase complex subunit 2 n=1 Tax=Cinara cedri TaxID=506608 RepID=A0A5E4NET9_9HEMI|nr:Signal peptidase complex subunit 2 [Cinara cedri]